MKIKIGRKWVGEGEPVYIIAEIGKNFNGDIKMAEKLIEVAAECGVDAIKFQTLRACKLIKKSAEKVSDMKETLKESPYEMHKRVELGEEEHMHLAGFAEKNGVEFFSTPEDPEMVDLLEKVGVNVYKVASLDIAYPQLLGKIASKKKPVILSTGMATLGEIEGAISLIKSEGNDKIILLHCVSNYPPKDENANLAVIRTLKNAFGLITGYSDHTVGISAPVAAVAMGASVIEKHITLDKSLPGPDHRVSTDPQELKEMVKNIRRVEKMIGSPVKAISDDEVVMRENVRRKIVAGKNLSKGSILEHGMMEVKGSPGGIEPKYIGSIAGRRLKRDLAEDELICFEDVE